MPRHAGVARNLRAERGEKVSRPAGRVSGDRHLERSKVQAGVRLIENDVQPYRCHVGFAQPVDQLGNAGTRPRPAADLRQARFVDANDHHLTARRQHASHDVPIIESFEIKQLDGQWGKQA